jgi:hypothetical protein
VIGAANIKADWADSRAQSIHLEASAKNPIGGMPARQPRLLRQHQGTDPATGKHGATLEEQSARMLAQVRRIAEAAGGSAGDIGR